MKLYVFPVKYPFTDNVECFLDQEVKYIAPEFDEVIFVPLKKEIENAKDLPHNCSILGPVLPGKFLFILNGLYNPKVSVLFWKEFFANAVWHDWLKFKIWLIGYLTVNNIFNSSIIKNIDKILLSDDVCYFYWGKWSNILSVFWKQKAKCVSRFHGQGDLWEDEYHNYFPLRNLVSSSLNYAIHISSIGEKYFSDKYPNSRNRIFRLGSFDNGVTTKSHEDKIEIISCSSLWPLKRVDLIVESVHEFSKLTNKKIRYTHIGGDIQGVEKLKKVASMYNDDNLMIKFTGSIPHDMVLDYYQKNPCDIFINLSTTEGVPVSIMEAISFNIPVVATDVGGTSDVVSNGISGELVTENPSTAEVAQAILKIIKNKNIYQPRVFWNSHFNASKNYEEFAVFLKNL